MLRLKNYKALKEHAGGLNMQSRLGVRCQGLLSLEQPKGHPPHAQMGNSLDLGPHSPLTQSGKNFTVSIFV